MVTSNKNAPEFDDFEFLKDVILKLLKENVREEFKDLDGELDDLKKPRSALKKACTPESTDTAILLILRLFIFYFVLGTYYDFLPIYGMPIREYNLRYNTSPNICLKFREINKPKSRNWTQTSQITFQVPFKTVKNGITDVDTKRFASKIYTNFRLLKWKTGWTKVSYEDIEQQIKILLFSNTQREGIDIVKKILDVIGLIYDPSFLSRGTTEAKPKKGVRSVSTMVGFARAEYVGTDKIRKLLCTKNWFYGQSQSK